MMHDAPKSNLAPINLIGASNADVGLFTRLRDHLGSFGLSPAVVWLQLSAVISLLCQGVADVLWPNGRRSPIGVSGVLVGLSGSGKSLIYNLLMEAIENYVVDAAKTDPPKPANFLIEDTTPAAIPPHLKLHRFAGLFTDEGGGLVHIRRSASVLAKLTDGTPLRRLRAGSGQTDLAGHRFVMLQLLQPSVAEESRLFSMSSGEVGLINRCLVGLSTPISGTLHQISLTESHAHLHRSRVYELLDATGENVRAKATKLPALELTADAREYFEHISDDARHQGYQAAPASSGLSEYLSRHGERALRLAGAIHLYNHGLGGLSIKISQSTMQLAHEVDLLGIESYKQVAYRPSQVQKDAQALLDALRYYNDVTRLSFINRANLRRLAPNLSLTRPRLENAIVELAGAGLVRVQLAGKDDLLQFLFASPFFLRRYG